MASLYVRNLPEDVTKQMLQEKFRPAGDIQSIHISKDVKSGRPLGYAYVNFERQADAMCAIATLNKDVISGKPMHIRCAQRIIPLTKASEGKIFVNHLDKSINSVALYKIFCDFGNILSCKVPYDMNGCKGYGFIEFDDQSAAEESIKTMNGVLFNGQKVYVGPLKSLKERQAEQDARARRRVEQQQTFYQGVNLFVKNLDEEVDDERLQEQFSPFGTITSAKVMMKDRRSKGYGFVCFSSPEEASRALKEMNGHVLTNKPLYVALAQSKEERQAHLTNQRVQPTSIKDASTVNPNQLVQNPVGEMSALRLNEHEATISVQPQLTENIGSPPDTVVATSVAPVDEIHQSKVDTSVCSTKQDMNAQTEAIADVWITVTKRRPRKRN